MGAIIGKGGDKLRDVRARSGAEIRLSKENELFPGASLRERVATIGGDLAQIVAAANIVITAIENESQRDPIRLSRSRELIVVIPKQMAANFVGKDGCNVKPIQDATDTRITLSARDGDLGGEYERAVRITGQRILPAFERVAELVLEHPQSCLYPDFSMYASTTRSVADHAATARPARSYNDDPPYGAYDHGHDQGHYGHESRSTSARDWAPPQPSQPPQPPPSQSQNLIDLVLDTVAMFKLSIPESKVDIIMGHSRDFESTVGVAVDVTPTPVYNYGTACRDVILRGSASAVQAAYQLLLSRLLLER